MTESHSCPNTDQYVGQEPVEIQSGEESLWNKEVLEEWGGKSEAKAEEFVLRRLHPYYWEQKKMSIKKEVKGILTL